MADGGGFRVLVVAPTSVKRGNSSLMERARALTDNDVKLEILHCRVENLLHNMIQAVNLVDEKDIVVFKVGQNCCQVAGTLLVQVRKST